MPLVWCAISSHGFGHAAQTVPVLNALGRRVSKLTAVLRTTVPASFFEGRLSIPWQRSPVQQDVGCVQHGPLQIDVDGTWSAHQQFHERWEERVRAEADAIRAHRPSLVLSNISHVAIAAAARVGLPAIGLSSLSWDRVLALYLSADQAHRSGQMQTIRLIEDAYAQAELMVLLTPGVSSAAFKVVRTVAPVAQPLRADRPGLRGALGLQGHEIVVLVAFGGISFEQSPVTSLQAMGRYRFVLDRAGSVRRPGVWSAEALAMPFGRLMASADILITKPGYSTVVEAVGHDRPIVYVRRYQFADEQGLVEYLHRYGRGVELTAADFVAGRLLPALDAVLALPRPHQPPPSPTGADEAAAIISRWVPR